VNGSLRASNVYAAPANPTDAVGVAPSQTEIILEHGKMFNNPVNFFHTDYPDVSMLTGIQALDTQNSQETNQIAWAVNNREDSRKTAAEIKSANQQTQLISGVQVTLFSIFLRKLYNKAWLIVQSQALQNKIQFLMIPGGPLGEYTNNVVVINKIYDVKAAGDVDVLERQEKIQLMQSFWPVVQNTPIAGIFLADILKAAFPDDGDRYSKELLQGGLKNKVIQGLGQTLQAAVINPETGELDAHFKGLEPQLQELAKQSQMALQSPT
jgi:hypothetical protein